MVHAIRSRVYRRSRDLQRGPQEHALWLTIISIAELLAEAVYGATRVGGSMCKLNHSR